MPALLTDPVRGVEDGSVGAGGRVALGSDSSRSSVPCLACSSAAMSSRSFARAAVSSASRCINAVLARSASSSAVSMAE